MKSRNNYNNKEYRRYNEHNIEDKYINVPMWKEKYCLNQSKKEEQNQEITNAKNYLNQRNPYRYGCQKKTPEFSLKNQNIPYNKKNINKIENQERFYGFDKNQHKQNYKHENESFYKYNINNYEHIKNSFEKRDFDPILSEQGNHGIKNYETDEVNSPRLSLIQNIKKRNDINECNLVQLNEKKELTKSEIEKNDDSDLSTDELLSDLYFDIHVDTIDSNQKTKKKQQTKCCGKNLMEKVKKEGKEEETLDNKILLDHIKRLEYQNNIFLNNLLNMYYASVDYIKMQDEKIKEKDRIIHAQNKIINQLKIKKRQHNNTLKYEK